MRSFSVRGVTGIKGNVFLPGDKSIAHRCIIAASLSKGKVIIRNIPANDDCLATIYAFRKLGVKIKQGHKEVIVCGRGLGGLKHPASSIDVGNSGTTLRLVLGVLAGQNFLTKLTAGKSLSHRPMSRVNKPLRMMGAKISAKVGQAQGAKQEEYPPITIRGGALRGISYKMPVASAQVKSAILLAGLFAKGITRVIEPVKTRDHTERIMKLFKADIKVKGRTIVVKGNKELTSPKHIYVPGDISSASFFIVAAAILPNARINLRNVGLNPTRTGALRVLKRMGAKIQESGIIGQGLGFEPMGDIVVRSSRLKGVKVNKNEIPSLIDELPILMVAACFAKGQTIFEGVGELRVKETDRIRSMCDNLLKMGADIKIRRHGTYESIIINGVKELKGVRVKSFGDHRTAMSMIVAGLVAKGSTRIDEVSCINKSFPGFIQILKILKSHKAQGTRHR